MALAGHVLRVHLHGEDLSVFVYALDLRVLGCRRWANRRCANAGRSTAKTAPLQLNARVETWAVGIVEILEVLCVLGHVVTRGEDVQQCSVLRGPGGC